MIVESLLEQIKEGREGKNHGFNMGLPKLGEIIDGVTQSNYTLIFSNTGTGKSSLVLYSYIYRPLMEHLDDGNFKVMYYSLEMSSEMLFAKLLSIYIFEKYHIPLTIKDLLSKGRNYILPDNYYGIVLQCKEWLEKVEKIVMVYDKSLNARILYHTLCNELEKNGKFKETDNRKIYIPDNPKMVYLVVIDHLSLVMRGEGRTLKEEMDLISAYLVTLRNKCRISPVVIMQANRNQASNDRRKAGMVNMSITDLKDTGSPAQDAEVILSLLDPYKEKLTSYRGYDVRQLGRHFRILTVLKNRYGESDVELGCAFYGNISYFAELPMPDQIINYRVYDTPMWLLQDEQNDNELMKKE